MNRSYKKTEAEYLTQHEIPLYKGISKKALPIYFPIEKARLEHIPWITALFITSTTAYGFSLGTREFTEQPGWILVPLILQFLIAATSNAVFAVNQTLVSDLYPGQGASSTAVNNLLRCSMGAVGVALIDKMINSMGVGPTFAGLGLLTVALSPLCVVQWYWAMSWRVKRMLSK